MTLLIPHHPLVRVQHNTGGVGTATPGTVVVTGATPDAKGAVAELIASTDFDAYEVKILTSNYNVLATASPGCLDILIGAATEEILIANLLMGNSATPTSLGPKRWDFPLYIPAGSRLAAQAAGAILSTGVRVWIYLYGGGLPLGPVGTKVTTYGIGTVPNGTVITEGASGAEGAWAEITASTSEDHFALVPSFQADDSTMGNRLHAVDIGLGAATEEEIAQAYWFQGSPNEEMMGPSPSTPTRIKIPSGSRLTMRSSNNGTVDTVQGALHAVS